MNRMSNKNIYSADFETNNHVDDCYVWGWGIENIYNNKYKDGNSIEEFFDYVFGMGKSILVYYKNEKFDGQFILDYLLKKGFTYDVLEDKNTFTTVTDDMAEIENTFTTIIDDSLKFYEIAVYYRNKKGKKCCVRFHDSSKKINSPLAKMPKMFNLGIEKGDLDEGEDTYNKFRPKGYKMTESEREYLYKDVHILALSLKFLYDNGLDSMTVAGGAMKEFKRIIGKKTFDQFFPVIPYAVDEFIRKSYRGGWTYCLKNQIVGKGKVFDVNSLYPSVLYSEINGVKHLYPKGQPVYFTGKYVHSDIYPLYFQRIRVDFHLKDGYLPTIQLAHNTYGPSEYATDSDGIVELVLNSVDFELFKKHYDIDYIEYVDGYKCKAVYGIFDAYIDKFTKMKIEAKAAGNPALATLAKLYLNSLYGKFGMSKVLRSKKPYLGDDDVVHYKLVTYELNEKTYDYVIKDGYYIPVASYCTAYARQVTLTAAQKCYENGVFCYADTDSIHILDGYTPEINIDKFKLGFWDHESDFEKAIFIRSKTYAEYYKGGWNLKCAGMPDKMKNNLLDFVERNNLALEDIFKIGFNSEDYGIEGKLRPKTVPGGVVLMNTPFKILERRS